MTMAVSDATAKLTELVPLLFVEKIADSVEFYEKLGFEIVMRWESEEGTLGWCRLNRDSAGVMLQQACEEDGPAEGRGHGVAFFFICDDVDVLYAELTARGLSFKPPETAFYGMKQVFLNDPDGYQLCFQSAVRR
jgi:uncharacterized glyoxalase superfamily protein PhnB